jgi:Secretion system C-terminal sorting domain
MKKWYQIFFFSLLLCRIATAQITPYTGGDGSGYGSGQSAILTCLMYTGGIGSGTATAKSQLLTCLMYTGGDADGFATERTNLLSCVMYFGDSADGAASRYLPLANCPWYFGGEGDGYDKDSIGWCLILLPLKILNFSGVKETNRNMLYWQIADAQDLRWFEVERSGDGVNFTKIAVVNAAGNQYQLADYTPLAGINFYRLRIVEKDGKISYSGIVVLRSFGGNQFTVYPNPAKTHANVFYQSDEARRVTIRLCNIDGTVVLQQAIQLRKGSNYLHLHLGNVKPGIYMLVVPETGDKIRLVVL